MTKPNLKTEQYRSPLIFTHGMCDRICTVFHSALKRHQLHYNSGKESPTPTESMGYILGVTILSHQYFIKFLIEICDHLHRDLLLTRSHKCSCQLTSGASVFGSRKSCQASPSCVVAGESGKLSLSCLLNLMRS